MKIEDLSRCARKSALWHPVDTVGIALSRRKQSFINDRFLSDALVDFDQGELVISGKLVRNSRINGP